MSSEDQLAEETRSILAISNSIKQITSSLRHAHEQLERFRANCERTEYTVDNWMSFLSQAQRRTVHTDVEDAHQEQQNENQHPAAESALPQKQVSNENARSRRALAGRQLRNR